VLLGQLAPIDPACITGTPYLELIIGGETLNPRERLTSVAFAVEARTLPHDAATRGTLRVTGDMIVGLPGEEFILHSRTNANGDFMQITSRDAYGDWKWPQAITYRDANGYVGLAVNPPADRLHIGGDVRLASRLRFTAADADGGNFAVIGLDAGAPRNFEIYDYYQWGPMFRIWQGNRDVEMYGNTSVAGSLTAGGEIKSSQLVLQATSSNGLRWDGQTAALGRAAGTGNYSTDAQAGDLVLRPSDGKRLILSQGNQAAGFPAALTVDTDGKVSITGSASVGSALVVGTQGSIAAAVDRTGSGPNMVFNTDDEFTFQTDQGGWLKISGNQYGVGMNGVSWFYFNNTLVPNTNKQFDLGGVNNVWRTAYIGSAECGALVETNLQTEEEKKAAKVARFEEGDVLCWGVDQLELCANASDRLVQAVADKNGKPIVLGAELIKVLGPVTRGDILVASAVPGYAMVNNEPRSGSVIAQALEDFLGERGTIKAMIRKF
jgi:hypothetical protein